MLLDCEQANTQISKMLLSQPPVSKDVKHGEGLQTDRGPSSGLRIANWKNSHELENIKYSTHNMYVLSQPDRRKSPTVKGYFYNCICIR